MFKALKYAGIGVILLGSIILSCQGIPEFITQLHIQRAMILKNDGRSEEAIAELNYAINSGSSLKLWAYGERELIYSDTGRLDLALDDCNKAIELEPGDDYAYILRAQIYFRNGEQDKAIKDCSTAIKLSPNSAPYTIRATIYFYQKDYYAALQDLQKALLYDPNQAEAYYVRGLIYSKAGEVIPGSQDLALNDFNKAAILNPKDARLYYARSFVFSLRGDNVSALADLNKALGLAEDAALITNIQDRIKEISR
jgi:tetratricopeptide (TPR) repeat protein